VKRPLHTFVLDGARNLRPADIAIGLIATLLLVTVLLWAETGPASILGLSTGSSILLCAISLGSISLLLYDQKRWVITAILVFSVFSIRDSEDGFTVIDLVFALYVNLGLVIWFVKEVFVLRRPIVHSRFESYFLVSLILCLIISTIASIVHGWEARYGTREIAAFTIFFLYFPFRSVIRSRRDIIHLFIALVLFGMINGAVLLSNYQERVIESALAYGEVNARSALIEPLSGVLFCAFVILLAAADTFRVRLIALAGMSMFAGLLVLSLSRGPIVAALGGAFIGLALIFPFRLPRMLVSGLVALIINISLVFLFLPGFASSIFENIVSRVETLERLSGDKSLDSRLDEYRALVDDYIPASPVIGYGFGVRYSFYNPISSHTVHPFFTHSGYLHALYKFGIPVGLLLLSIFFIPLLRYPFASVRTWALESRILYAICFSSMIAMMVGNLTSNSITYYSEIMLISLILALFDYVYEGEDPGGSTR
jgi:hypothetical protein